MSIKHVYNVDIKRLPECELNYKVLPKLEETALPSVVDLRPKCPIIYDQGNLGSCSANCLSCLYEFDDKNAFTPSRLFLYYNERKMENDIPDDAGAVLSDGIKCLQKYGICKETSWTYDISKFAVKPPQSCYNEALNHKAVSVSNIPQNLVSMKNCLAAGFPFGCGIAIYESFESEEVAKTGMVPMPDTTQASIGGHALVCVGYDDSRKKWIMRNSWGQGWGLNGYFELDYEYLLTPSLCSDLWSVTKIADNGLSNTHTTETVSLETLQVQLNQIQTKLDAILSKLV